MNSYNQDYTRIINNNGPDKDIELFWYNYKAHILNIYSNHFQNSSDYLIIQNELDIISTKLNNHQIKSEWSGITKKIHNFQIFIIFFIIKSFKNSILNSIILNNIFIRTIKFIKLWNKIIILNQCDKIQLDNLSSSNNIETYGIILAMICKNVKLRKYNELIKLINSSYIFHNYWEDKNNYEINLKLAYLDIKQFIIKCVPIFLFNISTGKVDASISTLEYICIIYNFRDEWYNKNSHQIPLQYYKNISIKKFCTKFKYLLKLDDFNS